MNYKLKNGDVIFQGYIKPRLKYRLGNTIYIPLEKLAKSLINTPLIVDFKANTDNVLGKVISASVKGDKVLVSFTIKNYGKHIIERINDKVVNDLIAVYTIDSLKYKNGNVIPERFFSNFITIVPNHKIFYQDIELPQKSENESIYKENIKEYMKNKYIKEVLYDFDNFIDDNLLIRYLEENKIDLQGEFDIKLKEHNHDSNEVYESFDLKSHNSFICTGKIVN